MCRGQYRVLPFRTRSLSFGYLRFSCQRRRGPETRTNHVVAASPPCWPVLRPGLHSLRLPTGRTLPSSWSRVQRPPDCSRRARRRVARPSPARRRGRKGDPLRHDRRRSHRGCNLSRREALRGSPRALHARRAIRFARLFHEVRSRDRARPGAAGIATAAASTAATICCIYRPYRGTGFEFMVCLRLGVFAARDGLRRATGRRTPNSPAGGCGRWESAKNSALTASMKAPLNSWPRCRR